jgi:putative effector of murein hydrolase
MAERFELGEEDTAKSMLALGLTGVFIVTPASLAIEQRLAAKKAASRGSGCICH